MKKLWILGFLSGISTLVAGEQTLQCHFTEPYFRVELELDSGKLTKVEYDWDDTNPTSEYIYTVVSEVAQLSVEPTARTLKISAQDKSGVFLQARLDYTGNNGQSQEMFPFSVIFHDAVAGDIKGGCDLAKLQSYDKDLVDSTQADFVANSTQAIGLCMNRATSEWTIAPSEYVPSITKFFVLYRAEVVPGEPGQVSQSFSSAEREALALSLQAAQSPPMDASSTAATRMGMWNYCMDYAGFLRTRFEN